MRRVLSVKSSRGVSFSVSLLSLAGKPLGYLRTLLIAWAFGTSAGMDAFHLANGIVMLIAGSVGLAMESAVLPELARLRKGEDGIAKCHSVFALAVQALLLFSLLFSILVIVAPGLLIRFFARGFDAERTRTGAVMLWWLLPFAVTTVCRPALEAWALFTERYTLSGITMIFFNVAAIPALLALTPLVGPYAVAGCMSIGYAASFLLFFFMLRGVPLRARREALPAKSLRRVGGNSLFSLILAATGSVFLIVDRYFASLLPIGSVAALSYAGQVTSIIVLSALSPLMFFLARISDMIATDPKEARRLVKQAVSVAFAFFIPVGFFMAAAAQPVVSLTLGWGRFGSDSIAMTAVCLAAYAVGMIFSIAGMVLYRYAQASQRLPVIVVITFLLIVANAALDWLFVSRWGLLGLASATSVVQCLSFLLYYKVLMRDSILRFLREVRFFEQLAAASLAAAAAWQFGRFGQGPQLGAALLISALYLRFAERFGLMDSLPESWRPSSLLRYIAAGMGGFLKKQGE